MHRVEDMMHAGCTTRRGVRFWEEQGLLGEVARSDGDTRQFTDEQLNRAKIIAAAKFGGFDLETIGQMLESYDGEVYSALMTRLSDQIRLAVRLGENLPKPRPAVVEYDL